MRSKVGGGGGNGKFLKKLRRDFAPASPYSSRLAPRPGLACAWWLTDALLYGAGLLECITCINTQYNIIRIIHNRQAHFLCIMTPWYTVQCYTLDRVREFKRKSQKKFEKLWSTLRKVEKEICGDGYKKSCQAQPPNHPSTSPSAEPQSTITDYRLREVTCSPKRL